MISSRFHAAALPAIWCILVLEAIAAVAIQHPWRLNDSAHYLELARNLSGPGFVSSSADGVAPEALRSPGYPLFLNLLVHRLGLSVGAVVGLQMVMYLISVGLIAHGVIRARKLRLIFLLIAAIYVFPLFYSALLLSEALAIFLVAAIVFLLSSSRNSVAHAIVTGAAAGLATLVRADLLPLVVAIICVFIWRHRSHVNLAVVRCLAALISFFLVLAPYMLWNEAKFGALRPVPVASALGQSLYLATWESSLKLADRQAIVGGEASAAAVDAGLTVDLRSIETRAAIITSDVDVATDHPARRTQIAVGRAFREAAWERIRRNPEDALLHSVRATWRLLNTGEYPPLPGYITLLLKLISFSVCALGIAGAAWTLVSPSQIGRAPFLIWLSIQVPHLPLHTEARYTASVRLLVVLYAAVTVARLCRLLGGADGRAQGELAR